MPDEATAHWTSVTTVVEAGRVVKALEKGDQVRTFFTLGGHHYLGPRVSAIPYANGHVGIEVNLEEGRIEKSLEDLPSV
jgi:hypothetical protein